MKKILTALMLCFVSIMFVGCKSPAKEVTEEYMNTKSQLLAKATELSKEHGDKANVKMAITKWNNSPIDVLTQAHLYEAYALIQQQYADQWQNSIAFDSTQVKWYTERLGDSFYDTFYKDGLARAIEMQKANIQRYNRSIFLRDSLRNVADTISTKDEVWCNVYGYTVQISYTHPITSQKVTIDTDCYSYITPDSLIIVKVDESGEPYKRNLKF